MSPDSQMKRKYNQKIEKNMKKKLEQYELPLNDKQSNEMGSIVSVIESQHPNDLGSIFNEGMYIYIHTDIHTKYIHMYINHTYIHRHTYTHTHTHTHIHICTYMHM